MIYPVKQPYKIGYKYLDPTFYGAKHAGVDFIVPTGTPIYASHSGVVTKAYTSTTLGKAIWLSGGDTETRYGHNNELLVKNGQSVTEGQMIAKAGSTGLSTAPHCHLEMRINGKLVDPLAHISPQGDTVTQEQKDFEKAYVFWQYFYNKRPPTDDEVRAKVAHKNAIMQAQGVDETAAWHQIYEETKLGY